MNEFYLIQRGKIRENGGPSLTGRTGVINLDYMGSAEFEFGALSRSYRIIMHDFYNHDFALFDAEVNVVGDRTLCVFCRKNNSEKILQGIRNFIENPYHLKEYSELEKLTQVADITKPYTICHTRFWWCIDHGEMGQWMAFLFDDAEKIMNAIKHDYLNWWCSKSNEEREELYKEAMRHR